MADSLFVELKRRNVIKVAVAYLVLAWLVVQVTATAVPAFDMPEWVNTVVFYFGIIGFPFALFFSWAFEITPEGVKREAEVDRSDSITNHTGRKIDFAIISLLVAALGYFIYESRFSTVPNDVTDLKVTSTVDEQSSVKKPEGSSIAVLPFVNMSSDKEQEYFSDGISEEILNLLAQIPNLKVTSRSSAFSFKGKDIRISEVAKQLGVNNVLEGSVRKFGNRIRITAQLIEAGSDVHLWSDTYDRELIDLFTIQDEISAAIVEALKSKLGVEVKAVRRDIALEYPEAHSNYLQGKFFLENRKEEDLKLAIEYFDKAIALKPDYALAWTFKALANYFLSELSYGSLPEEVAVSRAKPAAEMALKLEPLLAEAHAIMGLIVSNGGLDNEEAITYYKKAIELNPNYSNAYTWYAGAIYYKPRERLVLREKAVQLDPLSLLANVNYGYSLVDYGRFSEAEKTAERMMKISNSSFLSFRLLQSIRQREGRLAEAANYHRLAVKSNSAINGKVILAFSLHELGLNDLGAMQLDDTEFEDLKYWFKNNLEHYLTKTRSRFPRAENDALGAFIRAEAEFLDGNYKATIQYLENNSLCGNCDYLILSYQQVGAVESANVMLTKRNNAYSNRVENGEQFLDGVGLDIAFMNGDVELAIDHLEKKVNRGSVIEIHYRTMPIYKTLRAHSKWPAILAKAEAHVATEAEKYLQLIQEKPTTL